EFNFYVEAPSPDGRYLTDVDWETGDLAVRDLTTGERRRITDKGPWSASDDYAEYGVFSPDGGRIAYSWYRGRLGRPEGSQDGYELRSIGVDGGDMRVHLPASDDVTWVITQDWSPDGSTILVVVARADRTTQLGLVSPADDSYRILKSTDWRRPLTASFSPDGRWIAFDFPPDPESHERDVFALAADGSREIPLVEGPGHDRLMGWLPDGSGILFHRESEGSKSLLLQRVRDGQPMGRPELVKGDVWSIDPFGFSRDAFFYGTHIARPQVHVANVDLDADRGLSAPEPVVRLTEPRTRSAAWSPDGQSLAYLSPVHDRGGVHLVVQSLRGEVVKRILLPLDPVGNLTWTANGPVLAGANRDGEPALWRVSLETGELQKVMGIHADAGGVADLVRSRISPDGSTVYYRRRVDAGSSDPERVTSREGERAELVAHDVASGTERLMGRLGRAQRISVSPDGSLLAFNGFGPDEGPQGLWVWPTDSGTPRLIHPRRPGRGALGNRGTLPFTPDGRYVLWVEWDADQDPEGHTRTIYRIPVDGSGAEPLMEIELEGTELAVSPDGRRIAFGGGEPRGEIWRLSGFDALESEGAVEGGPEAR
ncbi:MAG: hypothetical protein ACOC9H_02965, partial [Gemmatimonadota bacterium]